MDEKTKMELVAQLKEAVSPDDFDSWFRNPVPSLGNRTPDEVLNSPNGEVEIRRLITAINYGIPM